MSYWDRPDAQQALRDRAMDREWMRDLDWNEPNEARHPTGLDWEPQPADDNGHSTGARPDDPDVHETCGYVWAVHDNKDRRSLLPFGCPPSEQIAIERWGER